MKELEYTKQSVPKDKRFCTICGQVKRLRYFDGDSTHCSACCEKMLHTRVHAWCIPVVLFALLATAVAVVLAIQTIPFCAQLWRADAALADKRLTDACNAYSSAISDVESRNDALLAAGRSASGSDVEETHARWTLFEAGTRTWKRYVTAYAAANTKYDAALLVQSSLDADEAAKVSAFDDLEAVRAAYEEVSAFVQEMDEKYQFDTPQDMPYDDMIAELDAYEEAAESAYVKGYTEYYKATATRYYNEDYKAAIPYYEKLLEYLPDEYGVVYTELGAAALNAGDYDTAIESYEKILEHNRNQTMAFARIAEAANRAGDTAKVQQALGQLDENDPLRLQVEMRLALRRDDLAAAQQVREKAKQSIAPQAEQAFNKMLAEQKIAKSDSTILTGYIDFALYDAALSLVQGDTDEAYSISYDKAFNYAYYYAYITGDSSALTQSVINMAALCATITGNTQAQDLVAEVGPCDEATQKMIDGELTARDVFVEGKAEII